MKDASAHDTVWCCLKLHEGGRVVLVQRSFYLGIAHFLDESYAPTDKEKAEEQVANGLFELCTSEEVEAQLVGKDFGCSSSTFEWDYATADDRPGLPVLLYMDVEFDVTGPESEKVRESIERGDEGTLIFVSVGHIKILEMGELEILEDD
jgi:hypothetical protein